MKTSLPLLALLLTAAPVLAQVNGAPAARRDKTVNWPTYNGDLAGSRYLPLAQINAGNFKDLEIAWRFKTDMFGSRPEYKLEGTPLAVDGVLYTTAGTRRAEIAIGYLAELTRTVKDANGQIVEGSETEIRKQRDTWTFGRTMGAADPNWQLVATGD